MPFTFSHPLFVLPFIRQRRIPFSLSGLLMGSMIPDFEYFLKFRAEPEIGEWPPGQYLFNIPLAVILLLCFQLFIKPVLIPQLPKPFSQRFAAFAGNNYLNYLGRHPHVFLCSLLLGLCTHLGSDWLLYPQGPLEDLFTQLPSLAGIQPAIYLERSISVFALFYLGRELVRFKPEAKPSLPQPEPHKKWLFWLAVTALSLAVFLYKLWPYPERFTPWLIAGLSSAMLGLASVCIIWRVLGLKPTVSGAQRQPFRKHPADKRLE